MECGEDFSTSVADKRRRRAFHGGSRPRLRVAPVVRSAPIARIPEGERSFEKTILYPPSLACQQISSTKVSFSMTRSVTAKRYASRIPMLRFSWLRQMLSGRHAAKTS